MTRGKVIGKTQIAGMMGLLGIPPWRRHQHRAHPSLDDGPAHPPGGRRNGGGGGRLFFRFRDHMMPTNPNRLALA
jgi:hypothetical protein